MKIFLGQRVEKSEKNEYGWNDKIEIDSIDKNKPIVICLPGSTTISGKLINGMCKSVEEMLGISDFTEEEKPCNIYGLYYEVAMGGNKIIADYFNKKENSESVDLSIVKTNRQEYVKCIEEFAKEIVDKLFKPLVQDDNGQVYDKKEIARNFRNIHFVSFCFGSIVQYAINLELRKYLKSTGFELDIIEKLESQICILQAAPIISETKTGQTTVNFVSLADEETIDKPIQAALMEKIKLQTKQNEIGDIEIEADKKHSSTVYIKQFTTIEDEEHLGDFYLHFFDNWKDVSKGDERVGGILPFNMAVCLRTAMQNAVSNIGVHKFVSLKNEELIKPCLKYMEWANMNPQEIPHELLDIYNEHVNYANINMIDNNSPSNLL